MPIGQASSTKGDLNVSLDALGAVTPLATVTVKPQVSGTLEKIDFQEGQMVGAGAVLAEVDPRPYQALLDQAKGALAKDEAQLANAKVDLSRYQMLWSQNAISQQTVATQQALVRTDAGTIETDKAAVEGAALNLSYCRITSPVAGRVGLRQVDVGNLVQVGVTTAIVVVTQLQPMSIEFTVPEDQIGEIVRRVGAGAKLPVEAFDRSQTTKLADGTLSTLDNEVDPTTGTVKMRALFDNKDNRLFPSQFVNIRLVVNTLRGQTIVPGAAIQHGTSGDYVYVVKPDHTVSQRNIKVGPTDGEKVDVLSGLAPNELVVVDGADRLRDGAKVVVPGSKGAAADSGAPAHHRHRRRNPDTGDDGGN
ncbi:MAG TPA: efflux RND transporter periplasmic adaptor subunit [Rhizomicrobium sp.]